MKAFVAIALLTVFSVFSVSIAEEKPKIRILGGPNTGVVSVDSAGRDVGEKPVEKPKPYVKLTLEEIDRELSNIEVLREQYIAALNMLEGQKQFLLKLKADTTKHVREHDKLDKQIGKK